MIRCSDDFGIDWVTVMSDSWAEAAAFGVEVHYPEDDLPQDTGGHLPDLKAAAELKPYRPLEHARCVNRLNEIREYRRACGDKYFVVGWVEGPVAAYADIRGVTQAALDLLDDAAAVSHAMDVITGSALDFITLQVQAGAHCIGIGDAFCSQIGPELYRRFAFDRERRMVEHIHSLGALAKLHICGNTQLILPDMIRTGADIIDVDHLVPSMAPFRAQLSNSQVFSGKPDPVRVIQDGTPEQIAEGVKRSWSETGGRCIVSAGCEVPPGTTVEHMRVFSEACAGLGPCAQWFR
jgi:uroporphyrinogen decarboxylase